MIQGLNRKLENQNYEKNNNKIKQDECNLFTCRTKIWRLMIRRRDE